ncbi:zygote arrest protein 2.S-like [Cololabis saira]|uniref:zygote arrest protein 2.S-like n=1 Tax=Cololabis saira TaxID=129043 RepID=UPI002AD2A0F2|nr:zygote arrest protein 2.S-like [Cololabis saira]
MEGFLSTFTAYNVYSSPLCAAPGPGAPRGALGGPGRGWGKRDGRFVAPHGLSYLELWKVLLAQVGPQVVGPPAGPRTRDCGVQVNAQADKVVQCSLGPKLLLCDEYPSPCSSPGSPAAQGPRTPPAGRLRMLRPVSIYSPLFDRRTFLKRLRDGGGSEDEAPGAAPGDEAAEQDLGTEVRTPRGPSFQFLEQRYGFFHCKKCNIRWESAYVWCISGTSKVYFKQLCRKCQVGYNPYKVESILCKGCSQTCCSCEKKQRHINMKRPHRQDLCCRCKGMKLSCDATYSFKYIV